MKKLLLVLTLALVTQLTFAQSLPSYVPTNGLVGYWGFNGNANDESGNGNNGTVNGATLTSDRFGINGKAYDFNGINNFIEGISTNLPLGNSARSVSAWVSMPGINYNNINFITSWGYGDANQSSANKAFGVMIGAGLTVMGIWPSFTSSQNENNIIYNTNFSTNDYYHIVVTIDSLGFFKFHINSTLVYSSNITDMATIANGGVFRIGRSTHTNTDGWAGYFLGKIDDLAIYNRALTQQEITQLYTSTPAPTEVAIGSQTWTTRNLDVATYSDGTIIPQVTDPSEWGNLTTGAWCYYNNDNSNGATYGKLYNWYAVAGIHDNDPNTPNKKLAPTGYHVPSDGEWTTLTDYLGGETVAGGKMKETGTTHWPSPNQDATNTSGFTALPGGCRNNSGTFSYYGDYGKLGSSTFWWSSLEDGSQLAWNRYVSALC